MQWAIQEVKTRISGTQEKGWSELLFCPSSRQSYQLLSTLLSAIVVTSNRHPKIIFPKHTEVSSHRTHHTANPWDQMHPTTTTNTTKNQTIHKPLSTPLNNPLEPPPQTHLNNSHSAFDAVYIYSSCTTFHQPILCGKLTQCHSDNCQSHLAVSSTGNFWLSLKISWSLLPQTLSFLSCHTFCIHQACPDCKNRIVGQKVIFF